MSSDRSERDATREAASRLTTASPEETRALGRNLAARLQRGDCVGLFGELGSGKTCLAQGICEGLKVADPVTSPTFILVNEYRGEDREGRPLPVYHFDLYRLDEAEELIDLGWDDCLDGGGICLVEWAERAGGLLPAGAVRVEIEAPAPQVRAFRITYGE